MTELSYIIKDEIVITLNGEKEEEAKEALLKFLCENL